MSERVLICGDREWGAARDDTPDEMARAFADIEALRAYVEGLPPDAVVIEGEARGADRMAGQFARARGLEVESYPARWEKFGRAAGVIRNQQMLDEGRPTRVAFAHRDLDRSRGTADMVRRAGKAGLPVEAVA